MIELTPNAAIFNYFPWPPTSNTIYVERDRRRASDSLKNYKMSIQAYALIHREIIYKVKQYLHDKINNKDLVLSVHRFFFYRTEDLYTKKGTIKKNDVTNRIKCTDDALTDILGLDDRLIWEGSEKKCITKKEQHVKLIITPVLPEGRFNEFP